MPYILRIYIKKAINFLTEKIFNIIIFCRWFTVSENGDIVQWNSCPTKLVDIKKTVKQSKFL